MLEVHQFGPLSELFLDSANTQESQIDTSNKRILHGCEAFSIPIPIVYSLNCMNFDVQTTTGDDVRDFMKQLKNKITRRYRRRPLKTNYLNYPITPRPPQDGYAIWPWSFFVFSFFFIDSRIPDQSPVFDNVHTRVNLLALR